MRARKTPDINGLKITRSSAVSKKLSTNSRNQIEPKILLMFFRNFSPKGGRAPTMGKMSIMVWE
jgi:hypothetical protein